MKNEQLRKHLKFTWRNYLRLWMLKNKLKECGSNVYLDKNVEVLRYPKNISIYDEVVIKEGVKICSCNENALITIGKNTTIGYHTFIFSSGAITIGENCQIAPFVYLVDSDHNISKELPINQQSNIVEAIEVGDDVWIGVGARILKGVSIGNGAVIAAGAVVSKNVDPYTIVGGIPAKKIGERK